MENDLRTDLITRCETAGPDEHREVILSVLYQKNPAPVADGSPERIAWCDLTNRVHAMLDCGAYESAVIGMVPRSAWVIDCATQTTTVSQPTGHVWTERGKFTGHGRTPVLALLAAILRAGEG